jgi:Undecaprenyl-phosphate glucose phosphotransferase
MQGAPIEPVLANNNAELNEKSISVASKLRKLPFSYGQTGVILACAEFLIIVILSSASHVLYNLLAFGAIGGVGRFIGVGFVCSLLYVLCMQAQHMYKPAVITQTLGAVRSVIITWVAIFGSLLAAAFLLKMSWNFSRGSTVFMFCSGLIALPINRFIVSKYLRSMISGRRLAEGQRVVLLGDIQQLCSRDIAGNLGRYGFTVVEQFGIHTETNGSKFRNLRQIAAPIDLMKNFVRQNKVDEILLVFAGGDHRLVEMVSDRLRELPLPTRLLLDKYTSDLLNRPIADMGLSKSVKLQGGPLTQTQQIMKRIFDATLAAIGLVMLAPILVIIAVLIKIDSPGPVMFRQRRAGFSGRTFKIYKFRTMVTLDDGDSIKQATKNDVRVTRVGRFLRKSSLDELLQLFNVLQGNMSIVGPRPHALSHDSQYNDLITTYALRHHMKPGITGWAQVNGYRGETSTLKMMEGRVEHDLWYIKHWSLTLDVKTIILTIIHIFRPKNVY